MGTPQTYEKFYFNKGTDLADMRLTADVMPNRSGKDKRVLYGKDIAVLYERDSEARAFTRTTYHPSVDIHYVDPYAYKYTFTKEVDVGHLNNISHSMASRYFLSSHYSAGYEKVRLKNMPLTGYLGNTATYDIKSGIQGMKYWMTDGYAQFLSRDDMVSKLDSGNDVAQRHDPIYLSVMQDLFTDMRKVDYVVMTAPFVYIDNEGWETEILDFHHDDYYGDDTNYYMLSSWEGERSKRVWATPTGEDYIRIDILMWNWSRNQEGYYRYEKYVEWLKVDSFNMTKAQWDGIGNQMLAKYIGKIPHLEQYGCSIYYRDAYREYRLDGNCRWWE